MIFSYLIQITINSAPLEALAFKVISANDGIK